MSQKNLLKLQLLLSIAVIVEILLFALESRFTENLSNFTNSVLKDNVKTKLKIDICQSHSTKIKSHNRPLCVN